MAYMPYLTYIQLPGCIYLGEPLEESQKGRENDAPLPVSSSGRWVQGSYVIDEE